MLFELSQYYFSLMVYFTSDFHLNFKINRFKDALFDNDYQQKQQTDL